MTEAPRSRGLSTSYSLLDTDGGLPVDRTATLTPRHCHKDPHLTWAAPLPGDPPRCFLVFKKWGDGEAYDVALSLGRFLTACGARVLRMPSEGDDKPLPAEFEVVAVEAQGAPGARPGGGGGGGGGGGSGSVPLSGIDLVVCVGGDGSLLRASALFPRECPPFIAVGRGGSLGFLTVHTPASARALLALLLHTQPAGFASPKMSDASDAFTPQPPPAALPPGVLLPLACAATPPGTAVVSRRMRLRVDVYQRGGGAAGARLTGSHVALNEVLLSRGAATYMAQVDAFVDGLPLTTVLADGLIVSTQTGSTAYALSAGGPMLSPNASCISIVPICPHTLSFRPIVFDETAVIHLVVPPAARAPAAVVCDGLNVAELQPGDYVVVCASNWPLPLLARRSPTADWLAGIREKMLWNMRGAEQRKMRSS